MTLPQTPPAPLLIDGVTIFVDLERLLISYRYHGTLTIDITTAVYEWMSHGMSTWFDIKDFRGAVFDFRDVTYFEIGNTPIAIRASEEASRISDLSVFPVALIVKTLPQEVKVRTSMMGGDGARKHISRSERQALEFINEWNNQFDRTFDLSDDMMISWPQMAQTD